jgi:uncharacterized protein YjgD (DUF1641 family)
MTNEDKILQKLEQLEADMAPLLKLGHNMIELKDDLIPLQNQAFQLMIRELQEVEAGFEIEDFMNLAKQMMRGTRDFIFALQQMSSIIEFVRDMEPLLKSTVPVIIEYLDQLEQKGVFRIYNAMLDVRAKAAAAYDAEDIEKIGDGMVALLGLAKKLSDPKAIQFLERAAEVPGNIDLDNVKQVGPFGMASAGFNSEVKQGFGVMLELTKALGKLKPNGNGQAPTDETPAE